ncbi:ATP phosphoribosyltransferase regulatory subunit [Sporosarcina sp. PTS2304]|uniref:ATP phosphoribosyltransferase regulatory subunit n=1 Tax=Sporosarcina sp. PTS2304 TaxID=2283194 RepID=UPI000E0DC0CB|nr:ATP phosphoribosyltransferase regulatory subunit [Sporosarcina sp. PTS2304]AXH99577.1 ATP phosphoribosyltransferase regulatory subunit [Sporosarcina sp. PTS2304]
MYSEILANEYEKHEKIIETLSKRFTTYGYKRIKTSAFEQYDLYSNVRTSINQNEMIKVIDYTGEVLVLRPDVTIPLTQQLVQLNGNLPDEMRYYYVQEVFRQTFQENERIGKTQAGVEFYCESSPQADAETIMLACHALRDVGFSDVKIEIGFAGFFTELIANLQLTAEQTAELKTLIQAKNVVEIGPFLNQLPIDPAVKEVLEQLPLLYGAPEMVFERLDNLQVSKSAQSAIDYLQQTYEIVELYGLKKHIVIDLGLINHMGYYSGIIFQGYVENFGKPVLMGGRYDSLSEEFGVKLPAIGFACEIESLVKAAAQKELKERYSLDLTVFYEESRMKYAIDITNELRERDYRVVSRPLKGPAAAIDSHYTIQLVAGRNVLLDAEETKEFEDFKQLLECIISKKGVPEWII